MILFFISQIFSMVLTLFRLGRTSETDKDLEILILRQQLGILQRKQTKLIQPNRAEKLTLAVLAASLKGQTNKPLSMQILGSQLSLDRFERGLIFFIVRGKPFSFLLIVTTPAIRKADSP